MASTVITGTYLSDTIGSKVEDISPEFKALSRADVPFLNAIGFGNLSGGIEAKSDVHVWPDLAYQHNKCPLNTDVSAADTTFVFTKKGFNAGDEISLDGERIRLGDKNADGVTFGAGGTVCTRRLGTPAAAIHTAGAVAVLIRRPILEGAAAGSMGPTHEAGKTTNYCQIFHRDIEVSWQSDAIESLGADGVPAYDRKLLECMSQLRLEVQESMYANPTATAHAPSSSTKGSMKGVAMMALDASSYAALSGRNISESDLRTACEALAPYQDVNGFNMVMLVPPYQKGVFSGWQTPHVQADAAALQAKYGAPVKQIDTGIMTVDVVPWMDLKSHAEALIFAPSMVRPVILRNNGLKHTMKGVDGQRKAGFISFTGSVELHGEGLAAYLMTGVKVS